MSSPLYIHEKGLLQVFRIRESSLRDRPLWSPEHARNERQALKIGDEGAVISDITQFWTNLRESAETTADLASNEKHQIVKVYDLEDARDLPWRKEDRCTLES